MGEDGNEDEIEYGDDCLACYDADKTPKYIYASFEGIDLCPGQPGGFTGSPNKTFKLTQDPLNACMWVQGDITKWHCIYTAKNNGNSVLYLAWTFWIYFAANQVGHCLTTFTNTAWCGGPQFMGTNGIGLISCFPSPSDPAVENIMDLMGIPKIDGVRFEIHAIDIGTRFITFGSLRDSISIIVVDTNV